MLKQMQQKKGLKANLSTLLPGELAYCTDTKELYIGSSEGNQLIGRVNFPPDEIKTLYESNEDTNAYTDAEKAKLGVLPNEAYSITEVESRLAEFFSGFGVTDTDLTPTALTNGQTLAVSTLTGKDRAYFVCRNTATGELDTDSVPFNELTAGTTLLFFDNAGIKITVDATNITFVTVAGYNLKVYGVELKPTDAYQIEYDNLDSGLDATEVQAAIDEVVVRVKSSELNDAEQNVRLDVVEENLRKVSESNDMAEVTGTDVISLGTDVAESPLRVKSEGLLLDAENLVSNGDFSDGTTNFTALSGTLSIENDKAKVVGNGLSTSTGIDYNPNIPVLYNQKIYISGYIQLDLTNISLIAINIQLRDSGGNYLGNISNNISNTSNNQYISTIHTSNNVNSSYTDFIRFILTYTSNETQNGKINYFDNIMAFNLSTLIANKQYSPLYNTTFDLMTDEQIKAQMDLWVANGTLPNNILAVNLNKRVKAVGKNLFDEVVLREFPNDGEYYNLTQGTRNTKLFHLRSGTYKVSLFGQAISPATSFGFVLKDSSDNIIFTKYVGTTLTDYTQDVIITEAGYYYFSFVIGIVGGLAKVKSVMIELGSTATDYEPYTSSEMFIEGGEGYSLPNGVKDSIEERDGKFYKVQRVKKYTLQASDFTTKTNLTNNELIRVNLINTLSGFLNITNVTQNMFGVIKVNSIFQASGTSDTDRDLVSNQNTFFIFSNQLAVLELQFIFPLGTYATLAEAQADLAGTEIYYQLATPIEIELSPKGVVTGRPNGTVYVDTMNSQVALYESGLTTEHDINEVVELVKINSDGSQAALEPSDATLTDNQISSITGAAEGDIYYIVYTPTGAYVDGLTTISHYEAMEDMRFPMTLVKTGSNLKPDFDYVNIGYLFPQNDVTEAVYIIAQVPHQRVKDSPIWPHVHCRLTKAGQPVFKMEYKWYNPSGDTVPTVYTSYTMNANTATWTTGTISNMIYGSAPISGVGKNDSSILLIKLYRDDNVYVGDLFVDEFDIHYYRSIR